MDVIENLKQMRKAVESERAKACECYDVQISDIDAAIDAISDRHNTTLAIPKEIEPIAAKRSQMSIDEAVVEAVKSDNRKPAAILSYMTTHLSIETTINSVRTRLSRLKKDGRIARGNSGWVMPHKVSEGRLPLNENSDPAGSEEAKAEDATSIFGFQNPNQGLMSQ